LFSHFFRSDEARREFLLGMHGFGQLSSPLVVDAFDLSPFTTLADLGGATGHLAIAACERYSSLRAIVFDLSEVLPLTREMVATRAVADRVRIVPGDFFADPLPDADLFALGRILHDWSEDKIEILLRKVFERLPAGGALLIAEKLLDPDRTGPISALLQSLNMLLVTEGKERTPDEYESLLRGAGFADFQFRRTGAPLDAMFARKP
jgi:acetylserotonin N-methyltransferase